MKKLILILTIASQVLMFPTFARADLCQGFSAAIKPLSYRQITVSSAAVGIPPLPPWIAGTAQIAIIVVEKGSIRYRDDGTNPTSTVGMPVWPGGSIVVCPNALKLFKAIRQNTDAILNITAYGN